MPLRFICDEQLGRLAKWLRLQGFDTVFKCPITDLELIRLAQSERRILLTRDRDLEAKTLWEAVVLIEEIYYTKQIAEVRQKIKLPKGIVFSRCLECNTGIKSIAKETARGRVPEEVFRTYKDFYQCASCKKIFWRGSHVKRSLARLQRIKR